MPKADYIDLRRDNPSTGTMETIGNLDPSKDR